MSIYIYTYIYIYTQIPIHRPHCHVSYLRYLCWGSDFSAKEGRGRERVRIRVAPLPTPHSKRPRRLLWPRPRHWPNQCPLAITKEIFQWFWITPLKTNPLTIFVFYAIVILRLKEAGEARTLIVSIEGLECSEPLRNALDEHAKCMVDLYRKLTSLISSGVDDLQSYQEHFDNAVRYTAWFKARKKIANSMKTASSSSNPSAGAST